MYVGTRKRESNTIKLVLMLCSIFEKYIWWPENWLKWLVKFILSNYSIQRKNYLVFQTNFRTAVNLRNRPWTHLTCALKKGPRQTRAIVPSNLQKSKTGYDNRLQRILVFLYIFLNNFHFLKTAQFFGCCTVLYQLDQLHELPIMVHDNVPFCENLVGKCLTLSLILVILKIRTR